MGQKDPAPVGGHGAHVGLYVPWSWPPLGQRHTFPDAAWSPQDPSDADATAPKGTAPWGGDPEVRATALQELKPTASPSRAPT